MRFALSWPWVGCIALACAVTHSPAADRPVIDEVDHAQPHVVSGPSGSRIADGYDRARAAELAGTDALARGDGRAALEQLWRAEAEVMKTLDLIAALASSGESVDDLHYATRRDGVLDQAQLVEQLERIQRDAHARRRSIGPLEVEEPTPPPDASVPPPTAPPKAPPVASTPAREPPADPQPPPTRALYDSTTFAAGTCQFSNCTKNGWTLRADDGQHDSRCSFGDCLANGWTTRHPDGSSSTTRCNFSNCLTDGWTTRYPDGRTSETRCNFSKCTTDGWTTRFGSRTVSCTCSFGDCLQNGSTCR